MKKTALILLCNCILFANLTDLDLQTAINLAKQNNFNVKIADYEKQIKQEGKDKARAYHFGSLDLSVNALRSNHPGNVFGFKLEAGEATFNDFGFGEFIDNMNGLMVQGSMAATKKKLLETKPQNLNKPKARTHFQTKLNYTLPIFVGGKIWRYNQIASGLVEMAQLDKQHAINEAVYQTKKTFYDLSLMESYITHLDVINANIAKLENMVKNMIAEGYAKKTDLLEVQAKRANVLRMLNTSKSYKDLTLEYLSFLINERVSSIDYKHLADPTNKITKEEALSNNLDLKKARLGVEITNAAIGVQTADFLPQIGAFAETGTYNETFLKDAKDKNYYTVGVGLKWNLFNGVGTYSAREEARLAYLQTQEKEQMAQKGKQLEISQVLTQIEALSFEERHLKKELELSQEVYKSYQERYKENLVSINDVLIKNASELQKLLELKKVQNEKYEKIFLLEKLANKEQE